MNAALRRCKLTNPMIIFLSFQSSPFYTEYLLSIFFFFHCPADVHVICDWVRGCPAHAPGPPLYDIGQDKDACAARTVSVSYYARANGSRTICTISLRQISLPLIAGGILS